MFHLSLNPHKPKKNLSSIFIYSKKMGIQNRTFFFLLNQKKSEKFGKQIGKNLATKKNPKKIGKTNPDKAKRNIPILTSFPSGPRWWTLVLVRVWTTFGRSKASVLAR